MSWGIELWDQWDNIGSYTQKGINFLENYSHFVRDRSQVETDYARSLRRLVKTYQPKKKEDEELQYTYARAFKNALCETGDLAGQHEVIAETLNTLVVQEAQNLIKELKEDRKRYLTEGNKLQQQLQGSLQHLEKAKRCYEKAYKEAEKAQENYHKADADLNLSRAEVEKQKTNASIKNHQCEDHKNEYANQLQKTNQLQTSHYSTIMPGIFHSLQDMDENRIKNFQCLLKKSVECEKNVFPIIVKCFDGIIEAANSIQEKSDSQTVIEKYKSGFNPPGDILFDDLSTPRLNGDSTPTLHPATRQETMKGTMSANKIRKRVGLFGIFSTSNKDDFSDLPPNQKKKKIQLKLDEVHSKLQQETNSRDGLLKLRDVYTQNPSLGDPNTIVGQLKDSCQTIEKLKAEIDRFNTMLDETNDGGSATGSASGSNTPTSSALGRHLGAHTNGGASPRSSVASHRTSLSDESLSRSASDSSVCTPILNTTSLSQSTQDTTPPSQPPAAVAATADKPPNNHVPPNKGSSHSPESGIGMSRNSLQGSDSFDIPDTGADDYDEEFYDPGTLPIIGTCTALYQFEATSEGSMSMGEGERMGLVEMDQGDGWTRVRRKDELVEGFVPTTYIKVVLDNNC